MAVTILSADQTELKGQTYFCAARDVSAGGIQIESVTPVPKGVRVKLLLAASSPCRSFRLDGVTVWSRRSPDKRGHLLGIEFSDVPPEALTAWWVFVGERLSKEKAI